MCYQAWISLLLGLSVTVAALDLDINSTQSIKDAATVTVQNTLTNSSLSGNVNPVYGDSNEWIFNSSTVEAWLYSTLIPYWNLTGNDTYNELISKRMYSMAGLELGDSWSESDNDTNMNHAAWALAAVTAAEMDFPADSSKKSWLTYAGQAQGTLRSTFKFQDICGGGLEIANDAVQETNGSMKDALSNGEFLQLSSRLAYITTGDNQSSYADDAIMIWDWCVKNDMLVESNWTINYLVTNTTATGNCTAMATTNAEYTYFYGLYMSSAAYMYSVTGSAVWKTRAEGLLDSIMGMFVNDGVIRDLGMLLEPDEGVMSTSWDDDSADALKGLLASCLAVVTHLLPDTVNTIEPLLRSNAEAVANQCSGMSNGTVCGSEWTDSTYDKEPNFFSSMSAVNAFTANLLMAKSSYSPSTTGTSTNGTSTNGTSTDTKSGGSSGGLSGGDIAGIVIGSVAGAGLVAAVAFFLLRKKKQAASGAEVASEKNTTTDYQGGYQAAELEPREVAELPQGATSYNFSEMDTDTAMEQLPQELPPQELKTTKTMRYELA
ncbi:glycoside hydrolase family 76 protein [Aspergillus luchuensis CBS 106.47]|uniref:mannan endo-1,6-alpha-mannosidase n=1 Tax=Aspergillus luchuensis (strain CBS 106.47) TaxID=1137211 RepID=A0A1M3T2L9_ASPLC|nr:glycoside hydrolase family 76 protein [Aspergillus luchuensis CBS 106.47]